MESTKLTIEIPDNYELDPIHTWFELSYAQYLTIPRSVLQSMPDSWQRAFATLLSQLDHAIDWRPDNGDCYWCLLRDGQTGRFKKDPLGDYERGRRVIPIKHPEDVKLEYQSISPFLQRGIENGAVNIRL